MIVELNQKCEMMSFQGTSLSEEDKKTKCYKNNCR